MNNTTVGAIDSPRPGQVVFGSFISISGWAYEPSGVQAVVIRGLKRQVQGVVGLERADVAEALRTPSARMSGFYLEVEGDEWSGRADLVVESTKGGQQLLGTVDATLDDRVFSVAQRRLLDILACPTCHAFISGKSSSCRRCGHELVWLGPVPSFLGRPQSSPSRGAPVSGHPALANAARYFDLAGGGVFLDAGAGHPPESHESVIQLEIERFPTTNVVGDGTEMPFQDEAFDGVMSHAVMEHVRDPFAYSRELVRVLKPGGRVLVHSAFLQPVHAYPHHYFNTSLEGLKLLFPEIRILDAGVEAFQQPWVALDWILRSYAKGINEEAEQQRFLDQTVRELIGKDNQRSLATFQSLNQEAVLELAAGVYLFGERA
ncbi:MAG TPA: class I SAM-dependent methyltransferase [Gemmatimonadaceae bacterium]|nr:class I SAM-dependent methyltransferase [Gemmatimonadaceae bacterium]